MLDFTKPNFFTYENLKPIIISVAAIIIAIVLWKVCKKIMAKYLSNRDGRKAKTASNVISGVVKYLIIVLAILTILDVNGVNVSSIVTGLGIVGIVVGLAVQDFLQDIVMGLHILGDDFYNVGDVVKIGAIEGTIVSFTVRTTKVRDLATGNVVSICNRNISEAQVVSNQVFINLPLSYNADVKTVRKVLTDFTEQLKQEPDIEDAVFKGTQEFGDSAITYMIMVCCVHPLDKNNIRRKVQGMAQDVLAEAGLEIPFNQLDVHLNNVG